MPDVNDSPSAVRRNSPAALATVASVAVAVPPARWEERDGLIAADAPVPA